MEWKWIVLLGRLMMARCMIGSDAGGGRES